MPVIGCLFHGGIYTHLLFYFQILLISQLVCNNNRRANSNIYTSQLLLLLQGIIMNCSVLNHVYWIEYRYLMVNDMLFCVYDDDWCCRIKFLTLLTLYWLTVWWQQNIHRTDLDFRRPEHPMSPQPSYAAPHGWLATPWTPLICGMAGCCQINSISSNIDHKSSIRILNQYPFLWQILFWTEFICFLKF